MVRNKANINVKSISDDPQKLILESRLPTIIQKDYSQSRIRISDEKYIRNILELDLEVLKTDYKEKQRAKEIPLLPFVTEAIEFIES
jgi:hypothetical protein